MIRSDPCGRSVHGAAKRVSYDFTEIVKRSRKAQGLSDHVSDPDTLRRIAQILQPGAACPAATQHEAVARGRSTDSTSNKGTPRQASPGRPQRNHTATR